MKQDATPFPGNADTRVSTGTLHLFNPWHDLALANGDANYQPPLPARQMADDLCTLPAWNACKGDLILVPDIAMARQWQDHLPLALPEVHWTSLHAPFPETGQICPWGWDAPTCKMIRLWAGEERATALCPSAEKLERLRTLSGRRNAVLLLSQLTQNTPYYIGESSWCTDEEEIRMATERYGPSLCKAPWSSSGKGLRFCRNGYASPLDGWCRRMLATQGGVAVEPLYDRAADFAMEFHSNGKGEIRFCGYSLFTTNGNGAYTGNVLATDPELERRILSSLPENSSPSLLAGLRQSIREILADGIGTSYAGPFGVDMMLCRPAGADAPLQIHPCVEINLRNNMGWLAHRFTERYLATGKQGLFRIDFFPQPEALQANHQEESSRHPLHTDREGRITAGYCPLTPLLKQTRYRAAVWVDVPSVTD